MRLQLGIRSLERERGDLPRIACVNMFAEKANTEQSGIVLQSRPGLTDRAANMGAGPVDYLFKRDGVLYGALFGVSNGLLYENTTSRGTIPGSGAVSIAGNEVGLMIARGSTMRFWNGTTLANVTFPDSANVRKVLTGGERFIMIRDGSGKFYWTPPLGSTVDALDFATAESAADGLLDAVFVDDTLVLAGSETIEFWPNTGDANLPFQPLQGRVFSRGVKATGCMVQFDASFAWVGNDNVVYTNGPKPVPLSDPGLEEKIAATVDCRLFTFLLEGSEFLALRVDAGTWVLNSRSGLWSEMKSYSEDNWIPQCFAGGVFGSSLNGATSAFNDTHADYTGPLERRFRAGAPMDAGGQNIANMTLHCNPGQTPYLTGQYADPQIETRLSRDAGKKWGIWKARSLGAQGKYRKKVQWRALGMASAPGVFAEFRCTDPVPLRVSGVSINDQWGGR